MRATAATTAVRPVIQLCRATAQFRRAPINVRTFTLVLYEFLAFKKLRNSPPSCAAKFITDISGS